MINVAPFTPDYKPMTVPLVDVTLQYDNPYEGKAYILVMLNVLLVPVMENNVIAKFMLQEAGITINETPMIHKKDPKIDSHTMIFQKWIQDPLVTVGDVILFLHQLAKTRDIGGPTRCLHPTPISWNKHLDTYSINEESMLD